MNVKTISLLILYPKNAKKFYRPVTQPNMLIQLNKYAKTGLTKTAQKINSALLIKKL